MEIQKLENGLEVVIIDVREPFEFSMGHAPGSVNIPLGAIPSKLAELKNIDAPIVLYCRSGNRSGQAAHYLRANGIAEAFNGGSLEDVMYNQRKTA